MCSFLVRFRQVDVGREYTLTIDVMCRCEILPRNLRGAENVVGFPRLLSESTSRNLVHVAVTAPQHGMCYPIEYCEAQLLRPERTRLFDRGTIFFFFFYDISSSVLYVCGNVGFSVILLPANVLVE